MKKRYVMSMLIVALLVWGLLPTTVVAGTTGVSDPVGIAQAPPLSKMYEYNAISVNYPTGWFVRSSSTHGIEIVNNEEQFTWIDTRDGKTMSSGRFTMVVLNPLQFDGFEDLTIYDFMSYLAAGLPADGINVGRFVNLKMGKYSAVRFPISKPANDSEGFVVGYKMTAEIAMVVAVSFHAGELEEYEETALAMIESISYGGIDTSDQTDEEIAPDELDDVPTELAIELGMTIMYPAGWVSDTTEEFVTIATSEDIPVANLDEVALQPGQTTLVIVPPVEGDWAEVPLNILVEHMADELADDFGDFSFEPPTSSTVNDLSGYAAALSQPERSIEGEVIGIETANGEYIVVVALSYTGEYEGQRELIWDLVDQIAVNVG